MLENLLSKLMDKADVKLYIIFPRRYEPVSPTSHGENGLQCQELVVVSNTVAEAFEHARSSDRLEILKLAHAQHPDQALQIVEGCGTS